MNTQHFNFPANGFILRLHVGFWPNIPVNRPPRNIDEISTVLTCDIGKGGEKHPSREYIFSRNFYNKIRDKCPIWIKSGIETNVKVKSVPNILWCLRSAFGQPLFSNRIPFLFRNIFVVVWWENGQRRSPDSIRNSSCFFGSIWASHCHLEQQI